MEWRLQWTTVEKRMRQEDRLKQEKYQTKKEKLEK